MTDIEERNRDKMFWYVLTMMIGIVVLAVDVLPIAIFIASPQEVTTILVTDKWEDHSPLGSVSYSITDGDRVYSVSSANYHLIKVGRMYAITVKAGYIIGIEKGLGSR